MTAFPVVEPAPQATASQLSAKNIPPRTQHTKYLLWSRRLDLTANKPALSNATRDGTGVRPTNLLPTTLYCSWSPQRRSGQHPDEQKTRGPATFNLTIDVVCFRRKAQQNAALSDHAAHPGFANASLLSQTTASLRGAFENKVMAACVHTAGLKTPTCYLRFSFSSDFPPYTFPLRRVPSGTVFANTAFSSTNNQLTWTLEGKK